MSARQAVTTRHIACIEVDLESLHRGGSTRTAVCTCSWRGPERGSLELAADDALLHEQSEFEVHRKSPPASRTGGEKCRYSFDATGVGGWCVTHRRWLCDGGKR